MQANMHIEKLDAQRNGYRDFKYNTPVGTLTLKVPKLTNGSYHPDLITEKYNSCDQCLPTIAHELYVSGVSIRKLEKYFESLGVTNLKRSAISELMKKLDKEVADFNSTDLSDIERPYLAFDATFMPCREES